MPSLKCPTCGQVSQDVNITESCVYCGGRLDLVHFEPVFTPGGVDLRDVARFQRWLVRIFPLVICADLFWILPPTPFVSWIEPMVFHLVVVLVALVYEVRLLIALNCPIGTGCLYFLLTFIPFLNLVVLFLTNARAIETLKAAGIRVGVMGVSDSAARAAMESNLCKKCGYNLTGNASGICPECGTSLYSSKGNTAASVRKRRTKCGRCGYDLTLTSDGNCPECDPSVV